MKKHALNIAAFVWGVAEATLFFIVPDVILSYIGLKRGPRAATISSLYAALGAAVGGAIMYLWSASEPDVARVIVAEVPAITDTMIARAQYAMTEHWFFATLNGPLSSTPFKVYAILAPHAGAPLWAFAVASIFARLPRFLLVSLGVSAIANVLRGRLSERVILALLVAAWIAFYVAFFTIMPNTEVVRWE